MLSLLLIKIFKNALLLVLKGSKPAIPANTTHPPNVGLMLAHRLQRRPNIGWMYRVSNVGSGYYHRLIINSNINVGSMLGQRRWPNIEPTLVFG